MDVIRITMCLVMMFTANAVTAQEQHKIKLLIKEIETDKGQLIIGFFKDEKSFKDSRAGKKITSGKAGLKNGMLEIVIAVEPGIYGVSVLDDVNANNNMDYNVLGIPLEGFGFSNYYHTSVRRPKFKDFTVDLRKHRQLEIRMKYGLL